MYCGNIGAQRLTGSHEVRVLAAVLAHALRAIVERINAEVTQLSVVTDV